MPINIYLYFWITFFQFTISLFLYLFREISFKKRVSINKAVRILNSILILSIISLFIIFILNYDSFGTGELPGVFYVFGSQIWLFISLALVLITRTIKDKYLLRLDYPNRWKARKGKIKLGKILYGNRKKYFFHLNIEDLKRHMFICGSTGSGKSNFLQFFLKNFCKSYKIPFLLSEFKGEYMYLQEIIPNLVVLKPGENYSINIFDPEISNPEVHAERILSIITSGGLLEEVNIEYTPQMERVLYDILFEICSKKENRSWESFENACSVYLNQKREEIMHLEQSITAIKNRLRRYNVGALKNIFATKSKLNITDLFDMNILLDLSSIIRLGGRKEDALFFLNLVLKYLWDKNLTVGSKDYKDIRHITIVEDMQYFAPQSLTETTKLTSYIEDIALLLRGTGECLISLATRPAISKDVLANSGVFLSFKSHMDKALIRELLNLHENLEGYLSMLDTGECMIRVNSIKKPFALKIPLVKRKWLPESSIFLKNEQILKKKSINVKREHNKVQKSFCKFCGEEIDNISTYCKTCQTKLEEEDRDLKKLRVLIKNLVE